MTQVDAELEESERYAQIVDEKAVEFALQDSEGRPLRLADLRGTVVVLNFLYARCRETCPLHSALIAKIQALAKEAKGLSEQIRFITVATDTEDEGATAALMREHGALHRLDPANWVFLHGGRGREGAGIGLAKAYGLEFVPAGDGEQMHGIVTHVIDPKGRLRVRFHGLKFEPVRLMLYAAALAHGEHPAPQAMPASAPREVWIRLTLGVAFAVAGAIAYGLLSAWSRRRKDSVHSKAKRTEA